MNQDLAIVRDNSGAGGHSLSYQLMPSTSEWQTMTQMAEVLVKSRFLPESVSTPQAALAIMLKGRELQIPPMQAFSSINIIKGKPTLSAELMSALVMRAGHSIRVTETSDKKCTVQIQRRGESHVYTQSFTIEEAKAAGLVINNRDGSPGTWHKYPSALLRARCISAACRVACPDVIMGMYTPEEMGAEVAYGEDGNQEMLVQAQTITEIKPQQQTQPQPTQQRPPAAQKIADNFGLGPDGQPLPVMTRDEFENWVKKMKTNPAQIAERLSGGKMHSVKEWALANPSPNKDYLRNILKAYTEWGIKNNPVEWNWQWDETARTPIAAQDIPFREIPTTHQVEEAKPDPWMEAEDTSTAATPTEPLEPLTGDQFADWLGVMTGRDPRTDDTFKRDLLAPFKFKTLSDWWKAARKNNPTDPYRLMLEEATGLELVGKNKWAWDKATGLPTPLGEIETISAEVEAEDIPL